MIVNTPAGPRVVPEDAKCTCVVDHRPNYVHPLPFALPNGQEYWLCPTSFYQARALLDLYRKLDNPPEYAARREFGVYVCKIVARYWQQVLWQRRDAERAND